jgi:hypothetical protein
MATNQAISGRWMVNVPVPSAVTVGMPVMFGAIGTLGCVPGVIVSLQPLPTPTAPTTATIDLGEDCYFLTAIARSANSPLITSAIKRGEQLYADAGTYDSTTNIRYSFNLDKNSSGTAFGNSLSAVAAGVTSTTCIVRLEGN